MELFAILGSIPVALIASMLYCAFLAHAIANSARLSQAFRIGSYVVLGLCAMEFLLLVEIGAVRSREAIGPAFTVFHILLFFLGTPALAGALVLRPRGGVLLDWQAAAVLCAMFAFCLVLVQYGVSEALFGIDGEGGPYSSLIVPVSRAR